MKKGWVPLPCGALPRAFFAQHTLRVARELIGHLLVRETPEGRVVGRVVEAEAYRGSADPACHAAVGLTARNAVMFGPPGHAYVYFTYGMHHCLNVVTERDGYPAAVLLRAVEPLEGIDFMRARRGGVAEALLASGPARLTQAFAIDLTLNGHDLTQPPLWLEPPRASRVGLRAARSSRVGVNAGRERPWRFFVPGHPCVSPGRTSRARVRRGAPPAANPDPGAREDVFGLTLGKSRT